MHKLVYTDERDLRTYESLPEKDFKEFFMAYFKYNKGDKIDITDFTNPITFALFNSYIPKLDKNEDTYNKKVNANRENGKKGGRPKKSVTSNEFDLPKTENEKIEDNNMGNFSGFTVNNNVIEQVEETNYTPIGDYNNNDISMYPSVEDFYSPIINDENTNTIPMKEIKQPVKIAASKQNSPVERLQDVINTDDNFYNVYNNCIDRVVDYKLHTGDIIKANKKEMAFAKLQSLYESYSIPWNKETKQFFMNDVDYSLNNTIKETA